MKRIFENDTVLKILSLVIAILLWIYIIVLLDPAVEMTVSAVPVTFIDNSTLLNAGYIVSSDASYTVDVRIKGSRKLLSSLKQDQVNAYVDLSGCTGKGSYELPISVRLPNEELEVVNQSIYHAAVAVDNYITRQIETEANFTGELEEKYTLMEDSVRLSAEYVSVSGPEIEVKSIEKAVVDIDLTDVSSSVSNATGALRLVNSNGSDVSENRLTFDTETVRYSFNLLEQKTVKIVPLFANGIDSSNLTWSFPDTEQVTVIGDPDVIAPITQINTTPIQYSEAQITYHPRLDIPIDVSIVENIRTVVVEVRIKDD